MNDNRAPENAPVAIIGLGPMGQSMTRALLAAGHPVTVWNRTARRADGVIADGATLASTPVEAVEVGELVILSLTDYQVMYDVLGGATGSLAGRTLVNLSSDTPDRTREAASWAAGHCADFLVGGVMVPAPMIGTGSARVHYSGPREVLARHQRTLALLGEPNYLGEAPGLAQMMYQAELAVFLTALSGLMHATAMLGSAGLNAKEALSELLSFTDAIGAIVRAGEDVPGAALDAGAHPGEPSTVTMMGATADHIVETSASVGLDLALPRAVQSHYGRAIDAGRGGDNWTRIIDVMRRRG
ncbi:NAD(P)-dependent oxidoreductase [Saccharopolyspora dendranthemae]|uniref:3-hydroxyisobutyrate dehydrogenase-like beta-hydroxyacid dehydrogenase n=1 Tax=Saccharopolyspora dendranthemae TaxID=1181886 RepID=A0A561V916_9PSEU|nr:NAD(P)-binding domain-containing protein [Saccharopolyspora dendranthemae]TWG08103.1 3-hydroxyisobutyrate dehydrogenase-like beta-hydroxyacid dehydrogenase [Saccharopolyspora dendranthemae]